MTTAAVAGTASPPVHPLIARLSGRHGCTDLPAETVDSFVDRPGHAMLVFTEDPVRVRETLDIAVIVPELMQAFPGRFRVGVLMPEIARALQPRYGFRRWPALVLLSDGKHVGAIDGLRNWDEYVQELARLLGAPPTRPSAIGIPVKTADVRGRGP